MKRFFSKNGIWLLAGVAIVVVVLCIISAVSSGTPFLRNAAGVIASPFRAAGSAVAGWFGDIGDHFDSVADLQQENEELRAQVADLERQLRQAQQDSVENQRLRELLGLRSPPDRLRSGSPDLPDRSGPDSRRSSGSAAPGPPPPARYGTPWRRWRARAPSRRATRSSASGRATAPWRTSSGSRCASPSRRSGARRTRGSSWR